MRSASEEDAKEHEDWTDLESDLVQRGAEGPQVKTTIRKNLTPRRLVTRVANGARGHGAGVLDAGVSASMITNRSAD